MDDHHEQKLGREIINTQTDSTEQNFEALPPSGISIVRDAKTVFIGLFDGQ
jgi:hypothetical protein